MTLKSLSYATYWRNSLADSAAGKGTFNAKDEEKLEKRPVSELDDGLIKKEYVLRLFKDQPEQTQYLAVTLRPLVFRRVHEHGQIRSDGFPDIVTPLIVSAFLSRDGRLYPNELTIPRELLEPLEQGSLAIGTVDELDRFISTEPVPGFLDANGENGSSHSEQWSKFDTYCLKIMEKVASGWPQSDDGYTLTNEWYLEKTGSQSFASVHILKLYDHLRQVKPKLPLFDRYASERIDLAEPCLAKNGEFATRLGHSSDKFELAAAQRDVLAHVCAAKNGEIIAVNGPPGTGKTTVLLSVIATLWAKAALEGNEPPVIVAASTNNQAVTNVIDAFGKGFATGEGVFAGRWLPDLKSFGAYLPSQGKEADAAKKYQTEAFFSMVENADYVERAQATYLAAGARAFPYLSSSSAATVVAELRTAIGCEVQKLKDIESAWNGLEAARRTTLAELGKNPVAELEAREQKHSVLSAQKAAFDKVAIQWEHYLAQESMLFSMFGWLGVVATKRLQRARVFLRGTWPANELPAHWGRVAEIDTTIKSNANQLAEALQKQNAEMSRAKQCIAEAQEWHCHWHTTLKACNLPETESFEGSDITADKLIRFKIFQLTTHYWEGRWLLEMQALMPDIDKEPAKKGKKAVAARWRRRMMLTPCAVSTLAMLPKNLLLSKKSEDGFAADYLYNFIDLLIVDEAGQVLPEVAGGSFALAKQALVIGDMRQIEPIWAIPRRIDIGNLRVCGLVSGEPSDEEWERLTGRGKLASSGSVMQIAQNACRYHYDPDLERGLYLYEHRRCLNEIVSYCNELSYHGKLLPRRAPPKVQAPLRPMAYQHIDGLCTAAGSSSKNVLEAGTIAAWLVANKSKLEAHYGKNLGEIVGVITPFAAQARAIITACKKKNIAVGKGETDLTVGTVHSFQGADRPIIIFSAVYSKHKNGDFIDRSKSMLNVAVSRAKDSFLVFGDMDVLTSATPQKPRRLLASYLLADEANDLKFEVQPRADLQENLSELVYLQDAAQHDSFLFSVLKSDVREILIVSPWVTLKRMEDLGYMTALGEAVQRGVKIRVYTDPHCNENRDLNGTEKALKQIGVDLLCIKLLHSKIVIADDHLLCIGSFNWFSASRDKKFAMHETSLVYRGDNLANEINTMQQSLKK